MNVTVEPTLSDWSVRWPPEADRDQLPTLCHHRAWTGRAAALDAARPIIATGHQAWLWHPGILAKDLAMAAAAGQHGASVLHLVADQDAHAALRLDVPVARDGRLAVHTIALGPEKEQVPTACQPPVDVGVMRAALASAQRELGAGLAVELQPIIAAVEKSEGARSLAQQVTLMLLALMEPWAGRMAVLFASELVGSHAGQEILADMLADAAGCVAAYNRAVSDHAEAGLLPLRVAQGRVELPLWQLEWGQARRRVFADVSGAVARLVNEAGETLHAEQSWLAPRAVLLSALMRSRFCDLFIHGRGGGLYDRVTEQWWQGWRGQALGPMAVVSADVRLPLDERVPVAERGELRRAQWWRHHLPHNVDRALGLDGPTAARKQDILGHMDDDRDRRRRAAAFAELHRINAGLVTEHAGALAEADHQLARAQLGVANRDIAHKRDWCFALYPAARLRALAAALGSKGRAPSNLGG